LLNIQSDLYLYKSNAATAMHESRLSQVRILANLGRLAKAYTAMPMAITSLGPGVESRDDPTLSTHSE
jgi:hypothetical protein